MVKNLAFTEPVDWNFGVHVAVEPVTTPAAVFRLESAICVTELSPMKIYPHTAWNKTHPKQTRG